MPSSYRVSYYTFFNVNPEEPRLPFSLGTSHTSFPGLPLEAFVFNVDIAFFFPYL
jgi:hypothetical protein